jgi:hypothetical protein
MGTNLKMLSEGQGPYPYNITSMRLELEECIHFHIDNYRLIWTPSEFKKVAEFFGQAKDELDKIGWPEKLERMHRLAGGNLDTKGMQHNRWAIEYIRGNWVHIHLGCMRILLSPYNFRVLLGMFSEASVEFYNHTKTSIDLKSDNIKYPGHVDISYVPWLKEYIKSDDFIPPTDVKRLKAEKDWHLRHRYGETFESIQRKMDEPFSFRYGRIPEELDKKYLCAVYESIKEWGYADGPFYGELMQAICLKDGTTCIHSAHRMAALLILEYDKADVFLTNEAGQ